MTYPTGSGSERIRTGAIHNQINADTSFKFDGTNPATGTQTYAVPANHIITILTIVFSDQSNSNKLFQLIAATTQAPTSTVNLLYNVTLGPYQTYIWNEKLVLHPTDKLIVNSAASANMDVFYTYIDQNWE